jgi:hypothetical protein
MRKGIVMELEGKRAVVMTRQGEFVETKRVLPGWKVGDEVEVSFAPSFRWQETMKWTAAVAALFLVVMMGLPWFNGGTTHAVAAWVTVDINPSVELSVNAKGKVVAATALNADGEKLINELDLDGLKISEATSLLLAEADHQGFITEDGGDVVVTTMVTDNNKELQTNIQAEVETAIQQEIPRLQHAVKATVVAADEQLREEAKQQNISPGHYAIYLAAKENGVEVDLEDFQNHSIHELAKENKGLRQLLDKGGVQINELLLLERSERADKGDKGKGNGKKDEDSSKDDEYKDSDEDSDRDKKDKSPGKAKGKGNGKSDEDEDDDSDSPVDIELPEVELPEVQLPPGDSGFKGKKSKGKKDSEDDDGDSDEDEDKEEDEDKNED